MKRITAIIFFICTMLLATTTTVFAQADFSTLNVVKVSGNVYEINGRLLTIIDQIGRQVKIFVPETSPVYLQDEEVDFSQLNAEDGVDVFTHNKNVALAVDIYNDVDITPTPEPSPTTQASSSGNNSNDSGGNILGSEFRDLSNTVGSSALRVSIAAAGMFLAIVAFAFLGPWIADKIGNRENAEVEDE